MIWLKQSVAADVLLGPFVDDTDFKTAETALTIAQADIRLSKNGGVFAQTNNVTGATHRENGHYLIPLDTTDTNTLGRLRVVVNEAGALQVWQDFMVVPANVWDSLFGADKLQVDTVEISGTAQTANDVGADVDAILVDTSTTLQAELDGIQADTEDIQTKIGTPVGASVSADIAAIEAQTDDIGVAGAGLTAVPWNAAWDAEVQSEVADALDAAVPVTPTADSINERIKTIDDADIPSRLPAALDTGRMVSKAEVVTDKTGYAIGTGGIAAAAFAANAIDSAALDASATPRVLKNTALNNFMFLMVDSTDHITPESGLSWAAGNAQVSIDGAAFGNLTNLPTEVGAGVYKINLAAADLNGDTIVLKFTNTGADQRTISLVTQP